ncbi:MAG: translational machinery protein, partial [Proteobacteria bacterium]|nr:translational machinery protein [Pseudomonadota bacterium]
MAPHHFHAAVWIDHHEARVFHFNTSQLDQATIHPDHPARHLHHKAGAIGAGNSAEDHKYLASVAAALTDAGAILIVGPSSAKTELIKHLHRHDPKTAERVVGIETSDHPSDGQIVAHARVYFRAADR